MATAYSGSDVGDVCDAAADTAAAGDACSSEEDPRYKKRSSGVNVLDDVSQSWSEVRDDANAEVDWILIGYVPGSRTDVTTLCKGKGGIESCSSSLPRNTAIFGGCRLRSNGRFVTFFYVDDGTSVMARGRASMHKNGVLNVLEGSDREIEMRRGMTEDDVTTSAAASPDSEGGGGGSGGAQQRPAGAMPTWKKSSLETGPGADSSSSTSRGGSASLEESSSSRRRHRPEGVGGGCVEPPGPACGEATTTAPSDHRQAIDGAAGGEGSEIPYSDLIDASRLPPGVDPAHRERYLSEDEFRRVFDGMDRRTFDALPAWKRMNLKKAKRLF